MMMIDTRILTGTMTISKAIMTEVQTDLSTVNLKVVSGHEWTTTIRIAGLKCSIC